MIEAIVAYLVVKKLINQREYKLKCVKSKEILIMHTFFVQERRKHEYEKNKY